MKNKKIKIALGILIILIAVLSILWIEFNKTKTYEIGEIKVMGINGYKVTFKQINRSIEPRAEIYANIFHNDKKVENFVFGSLDFDKLELKNYKAKCADSIIYIYDDFGIIEYYDLKNRKLSDDSIRSYLLKNDKEINQK